MNPDTLDTEVRREALERDTRRQFITRCATGLGALYLSEQAGLAKPVAPADVAHFSPKAKRVIYLHMIGAPSQLELFEHKPELKRLDGKLCPQSFLEGKRFAFIQGTPKMLGPQFSFQRYGQSGHWISERLPHFAKRADDVSFIRTLQTDQFNHGPAQLRVHTGQARLGFPSLGSWVTWGLGAENSNLPGFVVLLSGGRQPRAGKALWDSGFLSSVYQGVQCRSKGEPVLNVSNPEGVSRGARRAALDALKTLNRQTHDEFGDPETLTRIAQYEMAYRMQMAAPDAMDINREPQHVLDLYGAAPGRESFANNCLLARRLVERGVRYVQLFDWGWDTHGSSASESLNNGFLNKCRQIDQPMAALLADLKQRGLLDETLVVWSGEFGRTPMRENRAGREMKFVGRDHHSEAFTAWLAGGGIKGGFSHGETDEFGYHSVVNPTPLAELHSTMLHLLGFDHERMTVPFQGLNQRLTGVVKAPPIRGLMA